MICAKTLVKLQYIADVIPFSKETDQARMKQEKAKVAVDYAGILFASYFPIARMS